MEKYRQLKDIPPLQGSVVTLGMFDGMHLGHRAIVKETVCRAHEAGWPSIIITFRNHPRSVLSGRDAPKILSTLEYRLREFEGLGVDFALSLLFDLEFSELTREDFVNRYFQQGLHAKHIVLGFNCKFGKNGKGDIGYLNQIAQKSGFEVSSVPPVLLEGQAVSSTKIRHLIEENRLDKAAVLLGRPVSVFGPVVHGDGRGNKIGFPTANLDTDLQLLPPNGVYVCRALLNGNDVYQAVSNVGVRPTFAKGRERIVEVHILDFSQNIYGKNLELQFLAHQRDEKKFNSAGELAIQIQQDIAAARAYK